MTPPPGAHVIDEIVVPVVPFAWSVLLISVALLLVLVVAPAATFDRIAAKLRDASPTRQGS